MCFRCGVPSFKGGGKSSSLDWEVRLKATVGTDLQTLLILGY
jgi:hypothetical protein